MVLAGLRPGLCGLAGPIGLPIDDVESEAAFVVFEDRHAWRPGATGHLLRTQAECIWSAIG
jgi:hypothetical protein